LSFKSREYFATSECRVACHEAVPPQRKQKAKLCAELNTDNLKRNVGVM